jgi:TonB family protein
LSQHNQRVQEETRAQATGKFTNLAQPGTPQPGDTDGEKREEITKNQKRPKGGHLPDLSALKPDFSLTPDLRVTPPELPAGRPSQTDDYLKDTKLGIQTLLSTKEFVYYSYYNRIKEKIRQHWEPTIRENVRMAIRRGRSIASTRDRVTRVLITLDKDGTLLQVQVLGESGILELDEAAVQAFKEAAPFPNPPQGMVEQDGYIRIRWDFILEASFNYRLQHELEELKEEDIA